MTAPATPHPWMARVALRISAFSGLPLAPPKSSPCVLDLLGRACPQSHAATNTVNV